MKIFFVLIHLNIMVILNQKHVLRLFKYLLIVVRIVCSGTNIGKIMLDSRNGKSKLTQPVQNRENNKSKLTRPVQNRENNKSKLTRPVQNSKFKIQKITNPT
ncbi:hypothetical protein DERF_012042 [Dermatophagoides farinae]|uniref:Uncharacterized protein n=1 Tax=Dermatophagoides farinae TaxID=6954 RepID=A0A922KXR5_DERFA|nr:hypothetical protein DERF_012042 [Dermatophagoides farinae]